MKHPLISCTVKELQNEYAKISQLAKENPVIIKENEQESDCAFYPSKIWCFNESDK